MCEPKRGHFNSFSKSPGRRALCGGTATPLPDRSEAQPRIKNSDLTFGQPVNLRREIFALVLRKFHSQIDFLFHVVHEIIKSSTGSPKLYPYFSRSDQRTPNSAATINRLPYPYSPRFAVLWRHPSNAIPHECPAQCDRQVYTFTSCLSSHCYCGIVISHLT